MSGLDPLNTAQSEDVPLGREAGIPGFFQGYRLHTVAKAWPPGGLNPVCYLT